MVDIQARKRAHRILEKAFSGTITNWELENLWPESQYDPAINCIMLWLWTLYDDSREEKINKVLSVNSGTVDQCFRFLESDTEFPVVRRSLLRKIYFKLTVGVEWRSDCSLPEDVHWPFPRPNL